MIKILQQIKSANLNLTGLIDNWNASFELESTLVDAGRFIDRIVHL